MSRLTRKVENHHEIIGLKDTCAETCADNKNCSTCVIDKVIEKLADYEDKEEQGLLISLPCKVGDKVYIIVKKDISPQTIVRIELSFGDGTEFVTSRRKFHKSEFGKTVFLTRSEAEEALAKMGGK